MPQKIAIVNSKGGVGKSTTAVNLTGFLVASGNPCLLVDLDKQASSTKHLGMSINKPGLSDVILAHHSLSNAIRKTKMLGLDLIGLGLKFDELVRSLYRSPNLQEKSRSIFPPDSRLPYAVIIFDCPPDFEVLTQIGLFLSDRVLIPAQAEYFSLDGLRSVVDFCEQKK